MAKYCTKCGKEFNDHAPFCTECGRKFETAAEKGENAKLQETAAKPVVPLVQQIKQKSTPTSAFAFFGLLFVFAIPVIGWIVCLCVCFAAKKQSTKNFSRAFMLWKVLGAFFLIACISVTVWLGGALIDRIEDAAGIEIEITSGSFVFN